MKRYPTIATILILILYYPCPGQEAAAPDAGTLTDSRDGRVYKTVRIGNQTWMAENLDYGIVVPDCNQKNNGIAEKTYYENDPAAGRLHGGLYTWHEAMAWDSADGSHGICPEGWHLPSLAEWRKLTQFLGVDSVGQLLKASTSDPVPWDGTNSTGFAAIPSGTGYGKYFDRKGHWAVYWTSTSFNDDYAWFAQLDGFWYPQPPKYKILYLGNYYIKDNAFCIRCIKDR